MNVIDIIVLLLIAGAMCLAVRYVIRNRGSCGGDCGKCAGCNKKQQNR
ncbi:FeoB-associated Cys-rich membrane protein [uncultured Ruminococcus sp.]|nr:FeoB-associated Cys-rich membrane protein [uncultured Ruminococcus sp.]